MFIELLHISNGGSITEREVILWHIVSFVVVSDRYSITENNTISIFNGSVIIYTGFNDIVDNMKGQYRSFDETLFTFKYETYGK
ncbi:hypothetical protein [Lacrimispora sp.]|uniref:hypothetical protein n=1 Tax=Lacrimispora sp. TaxID=2719234 RepID=UPI002FDA8D3F